MTLNVLSLFAGIGGLELGLERAGMTVVGQVEIDDYCRRVLAKHWPDVPRHDDVRTATGWWLSEERPTVDLICGGFPCQDISAAGRRAGIVHGDRSSLWSFMADTVRRIRPRYVLVENVATILVRDDHGLIPVETVAADLASLGYHLRWDCLPAASVGAYHRRDRWFGIAHTASIRCGQGRPGRPPRCCEDWATIWPQALADAEGSGLAHRNAEPSRQDRGIARPQRRRGTHGRRAWAPEPDVARMAHGIPGRVDRTRALGNAVVPQVSEYVGRLIVAHGSGRAA